jgi:hypothetical protein
MRSIRVLLLALLSAVPASPASAQDAPLATVLQGLFADILLQPPTVSGFQSHEAHFLPSASGDVAPLVFSQAIASQFSSLPIGTSGGAFTYAFDSSLGTFSRSTESFGPSLAERAVTLGKGKGSFGVTYRHTRFRTFEGRDLADGGIVFFLSHEDQPGQPFFEGDLIEERVSLDLSTRTFTMVGSYGLTNRLDVGVVVPFSSVNVSASVRERVLRLATGEQGPTSSIHLFPGGSPERLVQASGAASGLGDVVLRGKYRLFDAVGGGLAAGVDVRLPTGDQHDLLGIGASQVRLVGIASRRVGRFAPHVNVGYTMGSSDAVARELSYTFGTEFSPVRPFTFSVELLGRSMFDVYRFEEHDVEHDFHNVANIPGDFHYTEFSPVVRSLTTGSGAFGVKYNPARTMVVTFNLLVPFTESGLTPSVTPIVGLDYSF